MGWLWSIIVGLIVGALAKFIMPGKDPGGIIITIIIGIAGSMLGTFLGKALGIYHEGEAAGFIGALIGAIILLWIYRLIVGRRKVV
ncbi:MAG: GlsB/YeaQ/YmgE family stress response membrane protein [Syntrophothermus sp.]|nr:GlsB/YeaQ/YmgE family stress response membrane protein [Ignavibacteriaceae bacterium]